MPEPPKHLSDKARSLWLAVVSAKPPDWFDEGNYPLLAMYCDLVVTSEELSAQRAALPVLHREAARLGRQHVKTVLAASTLAVKLRLTVQNTIDRRSGMLAERGQVGSLLLRGRRDS